MNGFCCSLCQSPLHARGLCRAHYERDRRQRRKATKVETPLVDLSDSQISDALATGRCPICGDGPFDLLGTHTTPTHGVSADLIRERLRLSRESALCSERHSGALRDLWFADEAHKERALSLALANQRAAVAASLASRQTAPTMRQRLLDVVFEMPTCDLEGLLASQEVQS